VPQSAEGRDAREASAGMNTEEYETMGDIGDRGLTLCDLERFRAAMQRFPLGPVVVSVKTAGANAAARIRSQKSNRYYRGVVLRLMAEHSGHSADELHDAMCEMFLPSEKKQIEFVSELTGEVLHVETDSRRTSKQNPTAFYDFVEQVRQWARDFLNVETPDPDPEYWRKRAQRTAA
jgi:hypothetical protein